MAILSSPGSSSAPGQDPAPDKDSASTEPTRVFRALSESTGARIQQVLNAPLANFYLVLVSSGLLIALGVMMVLSASSVFAYMNYGGDSYFFVKRQAAFAVVGLVAAIVLSRLNFSHLRMLAWPALLGSGVLLVLTYTPLGVTVNGNTNWVQFGPDMLRVQPSEYAK